MITWKDNELGYIQNLLEMRGNMLVPFDAIPSYLATQAASARRDNRPEIATALNLAMICWAKCNIADAIRIIREIRDES